jgi:hypothetical protein
LWIGGLHHNRRLSKTRFAPFVVLTSLLSVSYRNFYRLFTPPSSHLGPYSGRAKQRVRRSATGCSGEMAAAQAGEVKERESSMAWVTTTCHAQRAWAAPQAGTGMMWRRKGKTQRERERESRRCGF